MFHQQLEVSRSIYNGFSWRPSFYSVVLRGAALHVLSSLESDGLGPAACVVAFIRLVDEFGRHGVHTTVVNLGTDELLVASGALEFLESGEHLPENVLPAYLLLSEKHHELVDVPMLVALMF